jgi:tripartite-type tricarboxylate transporter receptor subunit TctC
MAASEKSDGIRRIQFSIFGLLAILYISPQVYSQVPFYKDKTITVLAATNAGGTADLRIRTVVSSLQKHVPGNPTIVVKHMPGGGGRMAANQLYKSTAPDGLTIGAMLSSYIPAAVMGDPGALYDVQKMIFLGTAYSGHPHIFISRRGAGADTLEKLRSIPNLRLGAQSVGHTIYYTGRMFAFLIGLKEPKTVVGYSGPELDIAFQGGEVDLRSNHPDNPIRLGLLEKGLVNVHSMIEVPKGVKHPDPRYAQLPSLESFTKSDTERRLLALHRTFQLAGNPFVLPPGTPNDQVAILQQSMRRTFNDPEFLKDYEKIGDDSPPLMPETLTQLIRELPRNDEVVELFKKLFGAGPLPPRP